jgi:hypothetical protein
MKASPGNPSFAFALALRPPPTEAPDFTLCGKARGIPRKAKICFENPEDFRKTLLPSTITIMCWREQKGPRNNKNQHGQDVGREFLARR